MNKRKGMIRKLTRKAEQANEQQSLRRKTGRSGVLLTQTSDSVLVVQPQPSIPPRGRSLATGGIPA